MPGPDGRPTPEEMQAAMANLRGPQPGTVEWEHAVRAAQPSPQERAYAGAMNSAEMQQWQATRAPMAAPAPPPPSPVQAAQPTPEEVAYAKAMDQAEMRQWQATRTPMVGMGSPMPQVAPNDPMMAAAAQHGPMKPLSPSEQQAFAAMIQRESSAMTPEAYARAPGPAMPPAPPRPPPTAVALKGSK